MGGAEHNQQSSAKHPTKRGVGPIFVCDASAEAERLITSLRNRGYSTVDVPLGMLPSRVRYELPSLVVCDADAHEALPRVKEMLEAASEDVLLLFVGHDDGALRQAEEFQELATATLNRPLNLTKTVDLIQNIVGAPPEKNDRKAQKARRQRAPVLVASARKPYRSDIEHLQNNVEAPEPTWSLPASASVPPAVSSDSVPYIADTRPSGPPSSVPPSSEENKLSSETRALLEEGRKRVAAHPVQSSRPTRIGIESEEQGAPAEELLQALKEPLGHEDSTRFHSQQAAASISVSSASPANAPSLTETFTQTGPPSQSPSTAERTPAELGTGTDARKGGAEDTSLPEKGLPIKDNQESQGPSAVETRSESDGSSRNGTSSSETGSSAAESLQDSGNAAESLERPAQDSSPGLQLDSIGASQRVGGPIPDRNTDRPSPSSDAVTLAPPHRSESELPPEDQTNPGGKPPTNYPYASAERSESAGSSFPDPLHESEFPPPLDDLSDLLGTDPQQRSASLQTPAPPTLDNFSERFPMPPEAAPQKEGKRARKRHAIGMIGQAIRQRWSGSLAQEDGGGVRRVLLREGDLLTATSSREDETLTCFLRERGDITAETTQALGPLPHFGRHAGAALIARGVLRQEDLWPVLRAHAEWILGRMFLSSAKVVAEETAPARISEEPAVFGGAAGAEIYMDVLARVVDSKAAFRALGSGSLRLGSGSNQALLGESALGPHLERRALAAANGDLNLILEREPELLPVLLGLTELGVLSAGGGTPSGTPPEEFATRSSEIDDEAFASRVAARRALVDEGDYFTLLGVPRWATGQEVDRARANLHRELSPERLSPKTAHLRADIELILQVVDEAHLILRDDVRRYRYRKALEEPPAGQ